MGKLLFAGLLFVAGTATGLVIAIVFLLVPGINELVDGFNANPNNGHMVAWGAGKIAGALLTWATIESLTLLVLGLLGVGYFKRHWNGFL